jgi:hypothetical protein
LDYVPDVATWKIWKGRRKKKYFCNEMDDMEKGSMRVLYLGYRRSLVTAKKSGYDRFPLAANNWGTKHPVLDMALPLMAEEEGPPT